MQSVVSERRIRQGPRFPRPARQPADGVQRGTLSLGVHNDSEKAIANLGYYNVQFLRPVYPGDTLRGYTKVVDRKARGEDKPGIVLIRTLGVNQHNQVVLQYERKIMVGYRGDRLPTTPAPTTPVDFPWVEHPVVDIPINAGNYPGGQLTGPNTYFEDFSLGDLIVHNNGRTITDEHMYWTYLVGNTHPLHFRPGLQHRLVGQDERRSDCLRRSGVRLAGRLGQPRCQ
jgi:2-methylfumaryl-CoA hydratase